MAIPDNSRIAKNTLFLYFRMLLIMGVTLYTSRVVLNQLGVVDYGIYNVVGGIVVMFSFLNGAMSQSTQRFLSFEIGKKDQQTLKKTFEGAFTIHAIIALIIIVLAETIGLWFLNYKMTIPFERITAANWVYQFSILSFSISIMQVPFNAAIISHEKMQAYAYIGILEVLAKLFVAISLSWITFNKLEIYALLIFFVTLIISLSYITYSLLHFKECCFKLIYNSKIIKSMSSYAAWSTLGSFAWIGKSQGCNLILNLFFGPAINAAYGITTQVNNALNSFVQNFTTAVNPQIVKTYASKEYQRTENLACYGSKVSYFLLLILSVPILILMPDVLKIWLKTVPEYTVIFARLIIINSLFESFSYCMGAAIQATGNIKTYQITVGITTLLNLPVAWILLYLQFPPYTILIGSIMLSIITLVQRLIIMKKEILNFSARNYILKVFLPSFYVSIAVSIILYLLFEFTSILNSAFILTLCISIAITGTCILIFGLSSTERQLIGNIIKARL